MKKFTILLCILSSVLEISAQDSNSSINLGSDLTNRFVWRGMNISSSPAIQPYIELNKNNFTLGTWGSYSLAKEPYQEVDLYLSFTKGIFTFSLNDYFMLSDSINFSNNYFNWEKRNTGHALEFTLTISNAFNVPLSLSASTMILGNDINTEGDNMYSTYIELAYDFTVGDETDASVFAGFTPVAGYYADTFSFINLGLAFTKNLKVGKDLVIPLTNSFVLNPDQQNVFLVITTSF